MSTVFAMRGAITPNFASRVLTLFFNASIALAEDVVEEPAFLIFFFAAEAFVFDATYTRMPAEDALEEPAFLIFFFAAEAFGFFAALTFGFFIAAGALELLLLLLLLPVPFIAP